MLLSEIQMEKHAALTRVSFTASGILFLHYAESIPPALHRIRPVECFPADHQKNNGNQDLTRMIFLFHQFS